MFTALTEELLELEAETSDAAPLADACSDGDLWASLVCIMAGGSDPWAIMGFGGCCSHMLLA